MANIKQYVIKRSFYLLLTMFAVSAMIFGLVNALPGNVARTILGSYATESKVAALEAQLGLNEPLHIQYLDWLHGVVTLDLGNSIKYGQPITELVIPKLLNSLQLAGVTMIIVVITGIALGIVSAVKHNERADSLISTFVYAGVSLPEFVTGLLLILLLGGPVFSVFPSSGYVSPSESVVGWAAHLFLPALTLSIVLMTHVVRQTRSEMVEALNSEYADAARLKGLSRRKVIIKHALRNSLLPTITVIALNFGYLMGGLVVVEELFAYPGIGRLVVGAIRNRDLPLVQAAVLVIAFTYTFGNFLVDILYTRLDPQIDYN
jgi:peptide/nickel transport system permease protein